jgi:galactofuranosylgalactofuranosylrhamnosyl-N-acetylglucosaminyl-diphospho-decaprenol beta-1,5/1,6-galactofuranosyltransferase
VTQTQHRGESTGPSPPRVAAGLLAQRGLFAGPETISPDLYARVLHGGAVRQRRHLVLEPATRVSGDTYFGRFPASYWQRWTGVDEVRVEASVTGDGRLDVAASDLGGFARVVDTRAVVGAERAVISLSARLDQFQDGGSLWLDLATEPGQRLAVDQVWWTVNAAPVPRTTSIAFCTYNRPEYCLGILRALADDPVALARLHHVYVVDQGSEPLESDAGFPAAAAGLGPRLRYLRQPNLGAAGGCNRGLYEIVSPAHPQPANVLFLDDDVLLEPELVIRMTAFGDHAAQPIIVGGQMLNLLHPHVLLADAQQTDIDGIQPGVPMPHARIDVDLLRTDPVTRRPTMQERRLDSGYNAWWACLISVEVVHRIGYMVPVFYQGDDADYCYRARANGIPTVTLPGSGLWHTDFTHKDLDDIKMYFVRRNYIIVSALHGDFRLGPLTRKLGAELVRSLLAMRYGLAATVLRAVDDFLAGPAALRDGGTQALRDIGEMRAGYPETESHPATAIPGIPAGAPRIVAAGPPPRHPVSFALARLLDRVCGRYRFAFGEVAYDEAGWWHLSRFRSAVVTDASQCGVRLLRHDRRRMLALARWAVWSLIRLRLRGARVRRDYQRALPALTSRESWTRLYRLDGR